MTQRIIEPAAIHRFVVRQKIKALGLGRDVATLKIGAKTIQVDLCSATLSSTPNWLVFRKITLSSPQGSFDLAGLSKNAVADIETAIQEAHWRASAFEALSGQANQVRTTLSSWDTLAARDAYLTTSEVRRWRAAAPSITIPQDNDADLIDLLSADDGQQLRRLIPIKNDTAMAADKRNTTYVLHQLRVFKELFDTVESSPLTDQQRQAIVHDEDNALVIAGAGTGKTSTVIGKVGFILQKGWAAPEEILLLAFTTKAADEMRERIGRRLGVDVMVRTFHGLGMEIIALAQGKKPSLCAEAEDRAAKAQTLKNLITDLLAVDGFRQDLLAFQSSLRRGYKPAWEFKSQSEYTQYLLDVEPRALDGRLLKSYEECEIANWLLTHGVPFVYERPYEIDTASVDHRQYKPDFFLPEHGIYIEHWGVDRGGNAAPFMDREKYRDKMEWARALHAQHGTKLVETYSWERQEGILLSGLETKLRALGVEIHPTSVENTLAILNEKGRIDPFITLVGTFLSLFKSAGHTVDELRSRTVRGGDAARAERFLRLFDHVYQGYDALVHGRGEIDYDDMISMARRLVADGEYNSVFRYILVDEFQDISVGRARLIQALRDQVSGTKLFCVGDDWQSIYRFTGSDISLTTEFEKHFGPTRKTALDRTFRFQDKIAAFSSRFVQKNPSQLRKKLSTVITSDRPGVVLFMRGEDDSPIPEILAEIAAEGEASVFVLTRYNFNAPTDLKSLQRRFPRLDLRAMTAHSSKGLEADYVVIDGLTSGKYGFPSEIADDPVLGMVLAVGEAFEFAEERRIFYVALTRAKRRVYLVADAFSPSAFVREILADEAYEKVVEGSSPSASDVCPFCGRGKVIKREGEFGVFYGCSNYPICSHREPPCARCHRGRMRTDNKGGAICDACGLTGRTCPMCKTGLLVPRRGRRSGGTFWGCSNYGGSAESCKFTEPVAERSTSGSTPTRQ